MPPPDSLHHASRGRDTLEQLQAERGRLRFGVLGVLGATVLVVVVLLPWMEVNVTVSGPARLRPEGAIVEVRTAMAGPLAEVRVRENQRVKRGEVLMELAAPALLRQRDYLRDRREKLEASRGDLDALLAGVDPEAWNWRSGVWAVTAERYRSQLRQLQHELAWREAELRRHDSLRERGLIAPHDYERSQVAVESARVARVLAEKEAKAGWQVEKHRLGEEWERVSAELDQIESQVDQLRVVAPVRGEVMGVEGWQVGQMLGAGEVVAVISPVGRLRVDARVGSDAVGFLREGMKARVLVDAFPHSEWGALEAVVESIAPDVTEASPRPHRVMLRLEVERLQRKDGREAEVKKGMSAQVRFLVTRRSLWQLFLQDRAAWLRADEAEPEI